MKQPFFYLFLLLIINLCSCHNGNPTRANALTDTVEIATISMSDSIIFTMSDNKECNIVANVEFSYPKYYVNKEKTEALQHLYASAVLEIPSDSFSLATAFPYFVDNIMSQHIDDYKGLTQLEQDDEDFEPVTSCKLDVKFHIVYNNENLLCISKENVVSTNGKSAEKYHNYFTFDLTKIKRLSIADFIPEDCASNVSDMLKDKLRSDMNISNDDELTDFGFFNFDNIEITDNFYFNADSIVWNYPPQELSVHSEIEIALDRIELNDIIKNTN